MVLSVGRSDFRRTTWTISLLYQNVLRTQIPVTAGNCPRFEVLITELAIGWNLVGAGVIVLWLGGFYSVQITVPGCRLEPGGSRCDPPLFCSNNCTGYRLEPGRSRCDPHLVRWTLCSYVWPPQEVRHPPTQARGRGIGKPRIYYTKR